MQEYLIQELAKLDDLIAFKNLDYETSEDLRERNVLLGEKIDLQRQKFKLIEALRNG